MNVSVVGAGAMGSAMAMNLLGKAFDVHVWDRTWERAAVMRHSITDGSAPWPRATSAATSTWCAPRSPQEAAD